MLTPEDPVPHPPTDDVPHTPPEAPAPPRPDPAWNPWDLLLIVVVFYFLTTVFALFGLAMARSMPAFQGLDMQAVAKLPLFFIPVQTLGTIFTLAFVKMYIELRARERFWDAIHWNLPEAKIAAQLCLAGALLALVMQLAGRFLPVPRDLPVSEYFRTREGILLMIAYGVLAAPLVEELFFRGLLYPALRRQLLRVETLAVAGVSLFGISAIPFVWSYSRSGRLSPYGVLCLALGVVLLLAARGVRHAPQEAGRWASVAAIVITAAGFSLMHSAQLAGAWAPLLMLFLVGMVLTLVRVRLHSTAASWLVHMSYNATLFVLLLLGSRSIRQLLGS
jgi:membrane protease YdiL (CAAX protease family)